MKKGEQVRILFLVLFTCIRRSVHLRQPVHRIPVDGDCMMLSAGPRDAAVLSSMAPFPTTTTRKEYPESETSFMISNTRCSGCVSSPIRRCSVAANERLSNEGLPTGSGANPKQITGAYAARSNIHNSENNLMVSKMDRTGSPYTVHLPYDNRRCGGVSYFEESWLKNLLSTGTRAFASLKPYCYS
jgi:hypothetical protein